MKRVIEKKLGCNDIYVLADDHLGIYAYREICVVAKSYGWDGDIPNIYSVDDYIDPNDIEDWVWQSDAAIDWLNENVCADGIRVDWYEGAIMAMPDEWWESDDDA